MAEDPALRELSADHQVACHFAEEVDGSAEQVQVTGRTPATGGPATATAATAAAATAAATATAPASAVEQTAPIPPTTPASPSPRLRDRG